MCEPLKGKKFSYNDESYYEHGSLFQFKDVKSAVEGFLKEVIKQGEFENGHIHVTEVKWLVKRWFEDVID